MQNKISLMYSKTIRMTVLCESKSGQARQFFGKYRDMNGKFYRKIKMVYRLDIPPVAYETGYLFW
jgi:hypothetical protein